jgi:hypothetical protein
MNEPREDLQDAQQCEQEALAHFITMRGPLAWAGMNDETPVEQGTVLTFHFPKGSIEIRHQGFALEITQTGGSMFQRLTMEPVAGNQFRVRLEP